MCGLFGWVSPTAKEKVNSTKLARGCFDALRHRGPDDRGLMYRHPSGGWGENASEIPDSVPLLLGHVRLSILDLSAKGRQPMVTRDGRYRIVFNGEVYNYRELRKDLEALNVRFDTNTDTEVVLNAFAVWGIESVNYFTGMFAMAVHDDRENRLYLIRDPFGIKPLFYSTDPSGGLFFSSELPVLLKFPSVDKRVCPQRIYDYLLFGDYDSLQDTMIRGIQHLLPAHYLVVDSRQGTVLDTRRYWKPDLQYTSNLSFDEAADKLRSLFLENVRLHLRSDVPFGSALSGGIDSSAVACAIKYLEPDLTLPTFTFVAPGSDVDEESWADQVIDRIGADAHKVQVNPTELVDDLDDLVVSQGEPFGSTSIYAQYRVFRLAKECGIKVTLDGQGADELLAGYLGFPGERLKSLLVHGDIRGAWNFFNATSRWPDRNRVAVFKRMIGQFVPRRLYAHSWAMVKGTLTPGWLENSWFQENGVAFDLPKMDDVYGGRWYVRSALAKQLTQQGLPSLLRHGDRNSMRFSIESRVPFLTREMAEFALSLPEEYLIAADGTTKAVFRHAMRGIVPDTILDRRDKIGFATPEKGWLKVLTPWVETVLDDAGKMPIFRSEAIRDTWGQIIVGKRPFDWQVWRWLNFVRWAKLFEVEF